MASRIVPDAPRFRLRWLATTDVGYPPWLDDPEWIPSGDRRIYSRAKNGLKAVFNSIDTDGTVFLPDYVPGGVAWAALAAGKDVRYYPVAADLTIPPNQFKTRLEAVDPDIVLFIHYFGFVDAAYPDLRMAAENAGIAVVEDCARGLFSRGPDGDLLGATGDFALFCLHKTIPAPNGGLVIDRQGVTPQPADNRREWRAVLRAAGASVLRAAGIRGDATIPTVDPSSHQSPTTVEPPDRSLAPGAISRRALMQCDPAAVQSARFDRYRALRERLVDAGATIITPTPPDGACPYGVGIMAPTEAARRDLYYVLHRRGLPGEVLTWPAVYRPEAIHDKDGALQLRRRLVVLPTHQQMPWSAIDRVVDCVCSQLE